MNQAQLLHLAKQNDLEAIRTLLNQSLQPRKAEIIEATVEEDCLTLKIQSKNVPNQYKLLPFLRQEISTLGIESLEKIKVYGLTTTSTLPAWEEFLILEQNQTLGDHLAKIKTKPLEEPEEIAIDLIESIDNANDLEETEENPENSFLTETETETETILEEDELTLDNAKVNLSIQKPSINWLPLSIALGMGFIWGIITGLYLGYQRTMNILESTNSNSSEQVLTQPNSPY